MTRQRDLPPLTDAQLRVVEECWRRGGATVGEICEVLCAKRKLARNTVHTTVVRLEQKGWLRSRRVDDRLTYSVTVAREETVRGMVRRLVDAVFGGSTSAAVMALLEERGTDAAEADRILRMIEKAERRSR